MKFAFSYRLLIASACTMLLLNCCKKSHEDPCAGKVLPDAQFVFKELIGDTAFITDTAFRDNLIQIQAPDHYDSVHWKLGSDPTIRTEPGFTLSFYAELGQVPITFTGRKAPDMICFPNDNGVYTSTKNLTLVEQSEKPIVTLSPLIGRYKGSFTDNAADTFTVRFDYFDSSKYDVSVTGSKNFYWLSNMPKGFTSTSAAALTYPELEKGLSPEMGYRSFVFGASSSSAVQGKGWLSHDTLFINYGNSVNGRRKFIGKKI